MLHSFQWLAYNKRRIMSDSTSWPRGLMDKASDFGSEDCEFESRRGRGFLLHRCYKFSFWYMHITVFLYFLTYDKILPKSLAYNLA